ncbi:MAG: hypothetical protein WCB46_11870 [Methanoregula sp.]
MFEDSAASFGLVFAFPGIFFDCIFHNMYLDGTASIAIGPLLMRVARILASRTRVCCWEEA